MIDCVHPSAVGVGVGATVRCVRLIIGRDIAIADRISRHGALAIELVRAAALTLALNTHECKFSGDTLSGTLG